MRRRRLPSLSMRNDMGGVLRIVSNFQTPERSDLVTLPLLGRIAVLQAHTHSRITRAVLYGRVTRRWLYRPVWRPFFCTAGLYGHHTAVCTGNRVRKIFCLKSSKSLTLPIALTDSIVIYPIWYLLPLAGPKLLMILEQWPYCSSSAGIWKCYRPNLQTTSEARNV